MNISQTKAPMNIAGPYSGWPRRRLSTRAKVMGSGAIATTAVFVHCIVPMLS